MAKDGEAAPVAVVFISTDTFCESALAATMSSLPSPLMSQSATEAGVSPAAKFSFGAKVGVAAPVGVVFISTEMTLS